MGSVNIVFTSEQIKQLDDAFGKKESITLNLNKPQFVETGGISVPVTKAQIKSLTSGSGKLVLSKLTVRKIGKQIKEYLNKEGVAIPLVAALLAAMPYITGAAGVAGAASGIASAVNAKKHQNKMLEETIRHNKAMETKSGDGLFLRKKGQGLYLRKNLNKN